MDRLLMVTKPSAPAPCEHKLDAKEAALMPLRPLNDGARNVDVQALPPGSGRKPLPPVCDTPVGLQEGILAPGTESKHPLAPTPSTTKPAADVYNHGEGADCKVPKHLSDSMKPSPDKQRRSARARKERIMFINGKPVLKVNNYDLEGGEPSVFDRELNKENPVAAPLPPRARRPEVKEPKQLASKPGPQVRVDNPMQVHNRQMKAERSEYKARRALYMSHHQKVIQPFMSPKALVDLKDRAAAAQKFIPPANVEEQPSSIQAEMRDYQVESLRWITSMYDNGVSCILGDEMGLGKTLQTIAFLANLKLHRHTSGPALVVAPLSVLSSWMQELHKWCPSLRAVKLHSCNTQEVQRLKKEVFTDPSNFDVAVTTYEMVLAKDMSPLIRGVDWRVLVLDEGHKIKNEETLLAGALRNVRHQFCLLLTGTPLQNNLHEFYALLSFLLPDIFNDSTPFDGAFNLATNEVNNQQLLRAHHLLKLLVLRRTKASVNMVLPPKLETRINCPLSDMQLFWYKRLLLRNSSVMLKSLGDQSSVAHDKESNDWKKMQMLLMQLRKCINHPYKFPGAEPDFDGSTGEDIVTASGKMMVLDRLLSKLKARGHRVVLFSQFNMMLDIIEDYLRMRGYKYRRLDGSTNRVQRRIDISVFNRPGSEYFIYILNTRAGGLGINLQTADTCIIYDSDWNPQVDVQAMARVHRIGQTKPVHIYRLFSKETVEERVLLRADKKLYLDKMVNQDCESSSGQDLEKLGMSEMLNMLQFGADRIFKGMAGTMPTDAELDAIMDRSGASQQADGTASAGENTAAEAAPACLQEAKLTAAGFAEGGVQQEPISAFLLNGEDYSRYNNCSLNDLAAEWRGKRERKSTTVTIDGYTVSVSSIKDQANVKAWDNAPKPVKKKRSHYENSSHCQLCWDGGELYLCDHCPAAYHAECLGYTSADMQRMKNFVCPHHTCGGCGRKAHAAGGMLMACEGCPNSYCEDCLPPDVDIVDMSDRFVRLGFNKPSTLCYIRCGSVCEEWCNDPEFVNLGHADASDLPAPKKSSITWWMTKK